MKTHVTPVYRRAAAARATGCKRVSRRWRGATLPMALIMLEDVVHHRANRRVLDVYFPAALHEVAHPAAGVDVRSIGEGADAHGERRLSDR